MKKIILFCLFILLLVSCGEQKKEAAVTAEITKMDFDVKKLPAIGYVNTKAKESLKDWTAFNDFEASFSTLYKAKNKQDLEVSLDDLIEKQKLLAKSKYPEIFNRNHIKSRLKVCKVYILKLKAGLHYGLDTQAIALELTHAHNAFLNQFNVTVNSIIDDNLFLEE